MLVSRFPFLVFRFRFCFRFRFRSLLYHTPSALRARPPVSGGQSGCGRFFWLCPSKLGGRGAKRRRGYVSFPFSVSRFPFLFPLPFSVISYPLRHTG